MASVLKAHDIPYNEAALSPAKTVQYTSNFNRAISLGIHTIDLGYASMYNRNEKSLDYFRVVEDLMHQLGLENIGGRDLAHRFEINLHDLDSLSKIILETHQEAHNYFQETQREGIGLLILTGCYIEGLYIISHLKSLHSSSLRKNLVGQQKIFLTSIIELLQFYINAREIDHFVVELEELAGVFESVKLTFDEKEKHLNAEIENECLARLKEKIETIRFSVFH